MTGYTNKSADTGLRPRCYAAIIIALVLFGLLFGRLTPYFWTQLALSAAALGVVAVLLERKPMLTAFRDEGGPGIVRTILIGLTSAAALYVVFLIGNAASRALFSFGAPQIDAVYGLGVTTPRWVIAVLLILVVGPCEEIFWRGYVQRRLTAEFGLPGLVVSVLAYGAAHIVTLNFMLIMAALVCGTFWALQYYLFRSVRTNMISHAAWASAIFVFFPMR
ncbi:MAG: type II CAAX endopeptidase family protein [bacterium]